MVVQVWTPAELDDLVDEGRLESDLSRQRLSVPWFGNRAGGLWVFFSSFGPVSHFTLVNGPDTDDRQLVVSAGHAYATVDLSVPDVGEDALQILVNELDAVSGTGTLLSVDGVFELGVAGGSLEWNSGDEDVTWLASLTEDVQIDLRGTGTDTEVTLTTGVLSVVESAFTTGGAAATETLRVGAATGTSSWQADSLVVDGETFSFYEPSFDMTEAPELAPRGWMPAQTSTEGNAELAWQFSSAEVTSKAGNVVLTPASLVNRRRDSATGTSPDLGITSTGEWGLLLSPFVNIIRLGDPTGVLLPDPVLTGLFLICGLLALGISLRKLPNAYLMAISMLYMWIVVWQSPMTALMAVFALICGTGAIWVDTHPWVRPREK